MQNRIHVLRRQYWPALVLAALGAANVSADARIDGAADLPGAAELASATSGTLRISRHRATGRASLARVRQGGDLSAEVMGSELKAARFFSRHGALFGIRDAASELVRDGGRIDALGFETLRYSQRFQGIRVYGAEMRANFDRDGRLASAGGTFVPDLDLDTAPSIDTQTAIRAARRHLLAKLAPRATGTLQAVNRGLAIYHTGLTRGVDGATHLVFEIELSDLPALREFLFVDAHTGKIVDQITGIHDALERRVYDGGLNAGFLVWSEGDATPFGQADIDNLIDYTEDSYNFYGSLSGGSYLSWDGTDTTMHAVANEPAIPCPNARWNGFNIEFCAGTTSDDVTAHEWGHGYTQGTHGLIYQYQSGALNEAYSDMFGEAIDLINGGGSDAPAALRTDGACSVFGGSAPPTVTVNAPAGIAGNVGAAGANFNPASASVTADVVLASDGSASPNEACNPLVNGGAIIGNIALIDRGNCPFTTKVQNAAQAGAAGVIIANNADDSFFSMGGSGSFGIPSVMIGLSDGNSLKAELGSANVSIVLSGATDNTLRWMMGEDATAFGGAIRDMWNPVCAGDPGKVSDSQYACDPDLTDGGGVHSNSGIPNHAFALLVDGGSYNGQTVNAIGLTRTAHIYWRAQTAYQTPTSNFFDHAESLEASCADLADAAVNLPALSTETVNAGLSGDVITAADCAEVARAMLAVEMRVAPTQCDFQPLLQQDPPELCGPGETAVDLLSEDFEGGLGGFSAGTRAVVNPATFDSPDWAAVGNLPMGRAGNAAFGPDLVLGDCAADIEAGVLYLQSPGFMISAAATSPRLVFTHNAATEALWDGGNVKIRVNGGAFQLLPATAFDYNPYNATLNPSDNPMAGEAAFTGTDGGSLSSQWGESHIDLAGIAAPGDVVRLRFEMGVDGCNGLDGWYVDDVRAYYCEITVADSDNDGIDDNSDNCTLKSNANQRDTDGDGFGNACDADFDNNCSVSFEDLGYMKSVFFTADPDADLDGNGSVSFEDLATLKQGFFQAPGPGSAPNICD